MCVNEFNQQNQNYLKYLSNKLMILSNTLKKNLEIGIKFNFKERMLDNQL